MKPTDFKRITGGVTYWIDRIRQVWAFLVVMVASQLDLPERLPQFQPNRYQYVACAIYQVE